MRSTIAAWMAVLITSSHAAEFSQSSFGWVTANPEAVASASDISTKLSQVYLQYNCDKSDKQKDPEYCAKVKAARSIIGKEGGVRKIIDAQEDYNAVNAGALESSVHLESAVESARIGDSARYGGMPAPEILKVLTPLLDYGMDPASKTPPPPY
ncbi:hypothetical protein [Pseudomonas sp. Teo4]|uniref:hypothetical protein n=1 Tax=Pseudomonas sp. Teo4 TaxID=3064528 RepID=UPI002ABBE559|nr:hypothetical protein [Pseudomonas sp. Teo4]MDZ3992297.1 hypothetical protein [Pseudomonas sp. Teo4]